MWHQLATRILGLLFTSIFLLAVVFPEKLWAVHWLGFLPDKCKWLLIVLAACLLLLPKYFLPFYRVASRVFAWSRKGELAFSTLIISLTCMAMYFMPIAWDEYGDAYQYTPFLETIENELPEDAVQSLANYRIDTSSGRKTVLSLFRIASYQFQINYGTLFKWSGLLFGFGFMITWLLFTRYILSSLKWRFLLLLLGILAPFTLIFYNHIELYPPVYFLITVWLATLVFQVRTSNSVILWGLLPGLAVLIKLHPMAMVLGFGWLVAAIHHHFENTTAGRWLLSWKGISVWLLTPLILFGVILYFFILGDHIDVRTLDNATGTDRLFLPLFSPHPPLDRYNLLSLNHILDYLNLILLWSVPVLMTVFGSFFLFRSKVDFGKIEMKIMALLLLLLGGACFMLNPLLAMPMDWDLFCIPALPLLFLTAMIVSQIEHQKLPTFFIPSILALQVMSLAVFPVNANASLLGNRLETVGIHVYKTYYQHSSRIIIRAVGLHNDMDEYLVRKKRITEELKPLAKTGRDRMYANLLMDDGFYQLRFANAPVLAQSQFKEALKYHPTSSHIESLLQESQKAVEIQRQELVQNGLILLREKKDYANAKVHFEKNLEQYPEDPRLTLLLMEACFQLEQFAEAYSFSVQLVKWKHPSRIVSLRIAIHCALEARLYVQAQVHANELLSESPDDHLVQEVARRLKEDDHVESIKTLFQNQ